MKGDKRFKFLQGIMRLQQIHSLRTKMRCFVHRNNATPRFTCVFFVTLEEKLLHVATDYPDKECDFRTWDKRKTLALCAQYMPAI